MLIYHFFINIYQNTRQNKSAEVQPHPSAIYVPRSLSVGTVGEEVVHNGHSTLTVNMDQSEPDRGLWEWDGLRCGGE